MDFSKIKAERASSTEKPEEQPVEAIIKVSKASYVPRKIKIRKRIDEFMFTVETTDAILKEIESDENIVSVQASEKIRAMRPKGKSNLCGKRTTVEFEIEIDGDSVETDLKELKSWIRSMEGVTTSDRFTEPTDDGFGGGLLNAIGVASVSSALGEIAKTIVTWAIEALSSKRQSITIVVKTEGKEAKVIIEKSRAEDAVVLIRELLEIPKKLDC